MANKTESVLLSSPFVQTPRGAEHYNRVQGLEIFTDPPLQNAHILFGLTLDSVLQISSEGDAVIKENPQYLDLIRIFLEDLDMVGTYLDQPALYLNHWNIPTNRFGSVVTGRRQHNGFVVDRIEGDGIELRSQRPSLLTRLHPGSMFVVSAFMSYLQKDRLALNSSYSEDEKNARYRTGYVFVPFSSVVSQPNEQN